MLKGYCAGNYPVLIIICGLYVHVLKFENLLSHRVWISNKIAKTFTHEVAIAYRQAFSLRQRMLDCIQHLEYYMMVEVVEPNWLKFINKMNKVGISILLLSKKYIYMYWRCF